MNMNQSTEYSVAYYNVTKHYQMNQFTEIIQYNSEWNNTLNAVNSNNLKVMLNKHTQFDNQPSKQPLPNQKPANSQFTILHQLNDKDEQTEVAEEGGADGFAANFREGADGKAEPIPPTDLLVEGEQSQLGEQPHRHRRRKLLLGRGAAANEHQLERVEVPAGHGHAEGVRPGGHAGAGHHGDARLQGDESEQDGRLKVLQRTGVQAVLVEGQQLLADNEQVDADVGEKGGHHDAAHHLAVARLGNGHQALALSVVLVQLVVQRRHLGGAADGNEENAGGVGV